MHSSCLVLDAKGGGIAIITGAQTGIPAIGISGPNAYISRDTFEPKLTEDALNTKVFNVMPNRDIIPLVDDPGNLFQKIQCRAPIGRVFACHSITRSLCEIMYQCGSQGRPGICECATKYGYPVPRQVGGNQTFSDICGDERENTYQQ
jgi:lipase ATG15